jgi:hypothetical protein
MIWKQKLFGLILSVLPSLLLAQKGEIKGRAAYISQWGRMFSIGIGYERPISDNSSWQVIANRMGIDGTDNDGTSYIVSSVVPEYRLYFRKNQTENIHRGGFAGIFNEFALARYRPSGQEFHLRDGNVLSKETRYMLNPGIIIGSKIKASERGSIELFAGAKYQFIHARKHYTNHTSKEYEPFNYSKIGWRVGVNFCYALSKIKSTVGHKLK